LCIHQGGCINFGIIAQEVLLKKQPYVDINLEPTTIISLLKGKNDPPFQPNLLQYNLITEWKKLIGNCWIEDPDLRPKFNEVLTGIDKMSKHTNISLVDNMIH
jgi:hypothetical protein